MSFDIALIDSDIRLKPDGTVRTVEKTNKLKQDIIKIILTPIGSVKFHQWYGSQITEEVVGTIMPDNMLFESLSTAMTQSLDRLTQLQRLQASQQRVHTSELIASVREVNVQRSPRDPRQVNVILRVISKSLEPIEEEFILR